jgi:hypothetical protein
MKRMMSMVAFGLGYVLGSRAGRERYEQITGGLRKVRQDPRVQRQAQRMADVAKEQAPVIKDKIDEAASAAMHKARPSSDSEPGPDELSTLSQRRNGSHEASADPVADLRPSR